MSNSLRIAGACLALAAFLTISLIQGSSAQMRLEFTGSTEIPSLKCIMRPQQVEWDFNNKTVCFCVWIQSSVPTWNCMKGDGKVTMDDLKEMMETIRNLTSFFPPIRRESRRGLDMINLKPDSNPEPNQDVNGQSNGNSPFNLDSMNKYVSGSGMNSLPMPGLPNESKEDTVKEVENSDKAKEQGPGNPFRKSFPMF